MLVIVGDAAKDIAGRTEENVRMATRLCAMGHKNQKCHSLGGQGHGGAFVKGSHLIVPFIDKILKEQDNKTNH